MESLCATIRISIFLFNKVFYKLKFHVIINAVIFKIKDLLNYNGDFIDESERI